MQPTIILVTYIHLHIIINKIIFSSSIKIFNAP